VLTGADGMLCGSLLETASIICHCLDDDGFSHVPELSILVLLLPSAVVLCMCINQLRRAAQCQLSGHETTLAASSAGLAALLIACKWFGKMLRQHQAQSRLLQHMPTQQRQCTSTVALTADQLMLACIASAGVMCVRFLVWQGQSHQGIALLKSK